MAVGEPPPGIGEVKPVEPTVAASSPMLTELKTSGLEALAGSKRGKVVDSFNDLYARLKGDVAAKGLQSKTPDQLTPDEKQELIDFNIVTAGLTNVTGKDLLSADMTKETFTNSWKNQNGEEFAIDEGIPVEGLIRLADRLIAETSDEKERLKLQAEKDALVTSSTALTANEKLTDPKLAEERKLWEAKMISENPVRKHTDADDKARQDADYHDAEKVIAERKVLVLPKDELGGVAAPAGLLKDATPIIKVDPPRGITNLQDAKMPSGLPPGGPMDEERWINKLPGRGDGTRAEPQIQPFDPALQQAPMPDGLKPGGPIDETRWIDKPENRGDGKRVEPQVQPFDPNLQNSKMPEGLKPAGPLNEGAWIQKVPGSDTAPRRAPETMPPMTSPDDKAKALSQSNAKKKLFPFPLPWPIQTGPAGPLTTATIAAMEASRIINGVPGEAVVPNTPAMPGEVPAIVKPVESLGLPPKPELVQSAEKADELQVHYPKPGDSLKGAAKHQFLRELKRDGKYANNIKDREESTGVPVTPEEAGELFDQLSPEEKAAYPDFETRFIASAAKENPNGLGKGPDGEYIYTQPEVKVRKSEALMQEVLDAAKAKQPTVPGVV